MKIDDLTIGEVKQLLQFCGNKQDDPKGISSVVGQKAIIRTYSAGVHFGTVEEKVGSEVILKNARRLYYWKTKNDGISLSEIANHGVHEDSKICEVVSSIWLQPIEIIKCNNDAINSIEKADVYKS